MAKDIVAKTWQRASESGFRYSGPPQDTTAPTAPVLGTPVVVNSSTLRWPIAMASQDGQTGVAYYTLSYSTSEGGTYTAAPPIARDVAESLGLEVTGLSASTTYYGYATATDLGIPTPNTSDESNITSGTTAAASANNSQFRGSIGLATVCQGAIFDGAAADNAQWEADFLEWDIVALQWFYPTTARLKSRADAFDSYITGSQHTKFLMYTNIQESLHTASATPQNDAFELTYEVIHGTGGSGQSGNQNWRLRTTSGALIDYVFQDGLHEMCNNAFLYAGENNLGERFDEAYVRHIDTKFNSNATVPNFFDTYFAGTFCDACQQIPEVGNDGETNFDMDDDGGADLRHDFAVGGGGRMWAESTVQYQDAWRDRFGDDFIVILNSSRWPYEYTLSSRPVLPLNQNPHYRSHDVVFMETVGNEFGFIRVGSGSTGYYNKHNGVGPTTFFFRAAIQERWVKPDAQCTTTGGRGGVIAHFPLHYRNANAEDLHVARFVFGACCLASRMLFGVNIGGRRALHLDEFCYDLGAPIGTPSMGTLNETTLGWSFRAANQSNGVARFHWQEYTNGIVVVRTDIPAVGTRMGQGTAVSCTLPATDTWARLNAASYTNPNTGLSMRGQDTTINSGAAVTSVSMLPYSAIVLRRT